MTHRRPSVRRAGTVTATVVLAGLATLPLAGAASAAPAQDVDCPQLSRSAAQAILTADPSDPNRLDADNDGLACEGSDPAGGDAAGGNVPADEPADVPADEPAGGDGDASAADQVSVVPSGGVEAGGTAAPAGSGPVDPAGFLLVGTGTLVAAGAGAAVWSGRRAGRPGTGRG